MRNILLFTLLIFSEIVFAQKKDLELWYKQPAATWTDALPIGNGRLGAMIYGDYQNENIQLNEESVWAGSKINNNNPEAKAHLSEIREAVFNGEYKKANELSSKYIVGTPARVRSYQPLGNLFINYNWKEKPSKYRRSLNINTGIYKTEYSIDGNRVVQEVFSSAVDDVIIVSVSAENPFSASFILSREFDEKNELKDKGKKQKPIVSLAENKYNSSAKEASIVGQIIDVESVGQGVGGKHMRYASVMKILSIDGNSASFTSDTAAGFDISNARTIVLLITGATDYDINKLDLNPAINPLLTCNEILEKVSQEKYSDLDKMWIT